jgi:uncharacterized membrane protein
MRPTTTRRAGAFDGVPGDGRGERAAVAGGLTTLAILAVAFGAMALGVPYFWVVFPVGFGGVLPLVVAATARRDRATGRASTGADAPGTGSEADEADEALAALRARYARGDLDEAEFERRLEVVLETETVGDAVGWTRPWSARDSDAAGDATPGDRGE